MTETGSNTSFDSGTGVSDAAQTPDAPTDVAMAPPADAATSDAAGLTLAKSLVCTQVMGVSITYDWFTNGFDAAPLDTTRWQLKATNVAGMQFIDEWSNPTSALWNTPVTMPCAKNSDNPDRIIFVGVNWVYTTAAQWVSAYNTLLGTLKAKYSNLKRVDLMTMLRAPGNMLCPTNKNVELVVQPFIDQAIQTVVKNNPSFVSAAPAFFAPDCSVFQPNSPHLVSASVPSVAKVFRDYYANEP